VAYRITKDQQEVWSAVETADHLHQGGEQLTIERFLPVNTLEPGRYTIEVTAIDLLSNKTVTRASEFTIKPAREDKPSAAKPVPVS
jgi:predicted phage tail protein